jgi:predicted transposase YdaD
MFALDDLRQTRVFQEIRDEYLQEGRKEGEISLVMRQIRRKFGQLDQEITTKITNLTLEQLERLGEELLDFQTIDDLKHWLENVK